MANMLAEMKVKRGSLRKTDTGLLSPTDGEGSRVDDSSFASKWKTTFAAEESEPPPTPSPNNWKLSLRR
jgi:hypothetical protein